MVEVRGRGLRTEQQRDIADGLHGSFRKLARPRLQEWHRELSVGADLLATAAFRWASLNRTLA